MEEKRRGMGEHRRKAICNNCRKRKSKCDSRQPQCSTCVAHKSPCHYDKPPSLAYVRSLEAKIEKLLLERNLNNGNAQIEDNENYIGGSKPAGHTATVSVSPVENATEPVSPSYQKLGEGLESRKEDDGWVSQISVDVNGGVSFHNPTSAIHEAPSPDDSVNSLGRSLREPLSISNDDGNEEPTQTRLSLVSNAAAQRRLEALAVQNMTTSQTEVSSTLVTEFLNFHWCWIYPMFMFVYRPAFTRDMARSSTTQAESPYFSESLLKVMLAHSARFHVRDSQQRDAASARMRTLTQQARLSLAMQITNSSSIPTVQALLQQSARDVAFGNSSQAWLYSGMAFRIAIDLGIHLPSERLSGYVRKFTAEDTEIRKRLFWSCYTWDKAISLYLGRMPAFTPAAESNPPVFMDDFTENEPWEPYYGSKPNDGTLKPAYPLQKGCMVSCFTGLCKLSVILSSVMLDIYGSSPKATINVDNSSSRTREEVPNPKNSAFVRISSSIHGWWAALPDIIRLDTKSLPGISPPLHIVSLNLLHHTTLILLHRPFINGANDFANDAVIRSYQICTSATASIHDLLRLLTSTFGYGHTTYLNCYSTYIAATIAVLHFQMQEQAIILPNCNIPADKLDLKFFLGVLQKSATAMPGLNRSIEIVKRHIQTILDSRAKTYLESLFPTSKSTETNTDRIFDTGSSTSTQQPNQSVSFGADAALADMHPPQTDNNYYIYPGVNLEGLPAFPGQDFNMGTNFSLDQEITDPEMRAAFLGLDPHLTLQHENSDWAYSGFYMRDEMQGTPGC